MRKKQEEINLEDYAGKTILQSSARNAQKNWKRYQAFCLSAQECHPQEYRTIAKFRIKAVHVLYGFFTAQFTDQGLIALKKNGILLHLIGENYDKAICALEKSSSLSEKEQQRIRQWRAIVIEHRTANAEITRKLTLPETKKFTNIRALLNKKNSDDSHRQTSYYYNELIVNLWKSFPTQENLSVEQLDKQHKLSIEIRNYMYWALQEIEAVECPTADDNERSKIWLKLLQPYQLLDEQTFTKIRVARTSPANTPLPDLMKRRVGEICMSVVVRESRKLASSSISIDDKKATLRCIIDRYQVAIESLQSMKQSTDTDRDNISKYEGKIKQYTNLLNSFNKVQAPTPTTAATNPTKNKFELLSSVSNRYLPKQVVTRVTRSNSFSSPTFKSKNPPRPRTTIKTKEPSVGASKRPVV